MKIVQRILLIISICFLSIILAALILLNIYKKDILGYFLTAIKNNITAEATIGSMNVSLFSRFPNASVRFKDVYVHHKSGFNTRPFASVCGDTLCYVRQLFVEFNLIDIFNKKYSVKRIYLLDGKIFLLTGKNGKTNYDIFNTRKNLHDTSSTSIKLSNVRIANTRYLIISQYNNYIVSGIARDLIFKGDLSSSNHLLMINGNTFIHQVAAKNTLYIENQELTIRSDLHISKNYVRLIRNEFRIAGQKATVSGSLQLGSRQSVDLTIAADRLDIRKTMPIIPGGFSRIFSDYDCSGLMQVKGAVRGRFSGETTPSVMIAFNLLNAQVRHKKTGITVKNIEAAGIYTNGHLRQPASSTVVIKGFHSEIGTGTIEGRIDLTGFDNPRLSGNIKIAADAGDLLNFFKPDSLLHLTGPLVIVSDFNLLLKKIQSNNQLNYDEFAGQVQITCHGNDLRLPDQQIHCTNISGNLFLNTHTLFTDSLSAEYNQVPLLIRGEVTGLLPVLMKKNSEIKISATIYSPLMNAAQIFPFSTQKTTGTSFIVQPVLNIKFAFDEFIYKKFTASNVTGVLYSANHRTYIEPLRFSTMNGTVSGSVMLVNYDNGNTFIKQHLELDQINIASLFNTFDNFGQTVLLDKNLSGSLSAKTDVRYELDTNNKLLADSLVAEATLTIKNGRLINFEPMTGLSRFAEISELKDIRFATLTNSIFIKNQTIVIPEMQINSSVINISGSGEHHFDNHYEYHVRVLMSDILWSKARKAKKENNEFGIIEDNGVRTSLYLTIRGKGNQYKVTYDSKKVLDVISEKMRNEKQELRSVLRKEFGLFKKDSLRYDNNTKNIRMEWDDTDSAQAIKTNTKKNQTGEKYTIRWDDE